MKLEIRIDPRLEPPMLRRLVERRTRLTLTRLAPQLQSLTISLAPHTFREGGEVTCRISAGLNRGGSVHTSSSDARPLAALELALQRIRRTVRRSFDRRSRSSDRRTIREAS